MRFNLVLCLFLITSVVSATTTTIHGIVKDSETEEPIPFAHVVIGDIISLSNMDGEFVIEAHKDLQKPMLQVSVMGYELSETDIEDVSKFQTIMLSPSTVELDEVTIVSGRVLMKDVFNRFHLNYEMSRQHMIGYYKEDLHGSDSIYYIAEGIVDIYIPPNIEYSQTLVSPIKTRKKVFKSIDDQIVFLKGNASDMAKSSIWRKDSFLSYKNRKNYDFIYSGMEKLGGKDVYIIEFEPINSKGDTSGKIFIEENSLAVVKLEYHPHIKRNTLWDHVTWTEEFYEKNGIYELFRVSYDGMWEDEKKDYNYTALLVVNETTPANEIPEQKGLLGENDSFFHEAVEDFSEAFWDGYNHMKLDLESVQTLKNQGISSLY